MALKDTIKPARSRANKGEMATPPLRLRMRLQTVDDVKRGAYLQRATEIVINETGIIPLHFQVNTWAARDGMSYVPRVDETTLAWKFKPKQH